MPSNNTLSRLTIMGWQFEGLNCNVCISITAFLANARWAFVIVFSIAFNSRNYPGWGYRFTANNLSKLLFHPSELGDASKNKALLNRVLHSLVSFEAKCLKCCSSFIRDKSWCDPFRYFNVPTYHYQKMVNMQRATIELWPDKRGTLLSTKKA